MTESNKEKAIKIKTIFMGTSDFAGTILQSLIGEKYNIVAAFTKPDSSEKAKKGKENPVKNLAKKNNIPLYQPGELDETVHKEIKKLKPDLIIVVSYGKILPKNILDVPGFGSLNIHASLLPKWRGPSPIQNAIMAGEKKTGVTIIIMNEKMDSGETISREKVIIEDNDTYGTLRDKLSKIGSELLLETLPYWVERKLESRLQDEKDATYCQLIERSDGKIMWDEDAQIIYNRYRGLHPWPGSFSFWNNGKSKTRLKLLEIGLQKENAEIKQPVGKIFQLEDKVGVQTLKGIIILEKIQLEGKDPAFIKDFVNGHPDFIGSILE